MNSEPRPCLISVGFPLSGPQSRTPTSDLIRHALRTSLRKNAGKPTLKWPSFHPTKLAYFSTGLDIRWLTEP